MRNNLDLSVRAIKFKSLPFITIVIIALLLSGSIITAQPSYAPNELVFNVYEDGVTAVEFIADVDSTMARVQLSLFGFIYEDLIVLDQEGLPLDYKIVEGGLTVDTLGSTTIIVSYVTPDLTDKSGQIWVFSVSTPLNSSLLLPEGATIVNLKVVPHSLGSLDGRPLLFIPAGEVEVEYTIGVVGTREHALILIKDSESIFEKVKSQGFVVAEAETLIQQAYAAFEAEHYVEAEQLAVRAKTSALSVEAAASSAIEAINDASEQVSKARDEGRTVDLGKAETLFQQAGDTYELGNYEEAEKLAEQAQSSADAAVEPTGSSLWMVVVGASGAFFIILAAYILKKRKPTAQAERHTEDEFLEAFLEEKKHLRFDDKEVLRFLAESGGEAFATEIRERFNLPRTSAWRMIRRLQREEIVEVENIGGQSLVRIKFEYIKDSSN